MTIDDLLNLKESTISVKIFKSFPGIFFIFCSNYNLFLIFFVFTFRLNKLAEEEMEGVVKGYSERYQVPWPPKEDSSIFIPEHELDLYSHYQNYESSRLDLPLPDSNSRYTDRTLSPDYSQFDYIDVRGSDNHNGDNQPEKIEEILPVQSKFSSRFTKDSSSHGLNSRNEISTASSTRPFSPSSNPTSALPLEKRRKYPSRASVNK